MKKKIIGILFCVILETLVLFSSSNKETKKVYVEAIDTEILPLTDYELSQLYICRQDYYNDNCLAFNTYDANLLMKISRAEGGNTLEGQLWSMRTILNRLDAGWADNIYDIVSMDKQFEVFTTGTYIKADVNSNSHIALAMIEGGWDKTEGALYWRTDNGSENSWHENNLTYIATVEGNRYYK